MPEAAKPRIDSASPGRAVIRPAQFREAYAGIRARSAETARECGSAISEDLVQALWYDQLFRLDGAQTAEGKPIEVVSPGWWNRGAGPDFRNAQIRFGDTLRTGDVEIDMQAAGWTQHGHALDSRYDDVILHVVFEDTLPLKTPVTAGGRPVPTLCLAPLIDMPLDGIADALGFDSDVPRIDGSFGRCADVCMGSAQGPDQLRDLLRLAGEWRMVFKARTLRQRMDRAGEDQAVYETILQACGYAHFKQHFVVVGRQLPYERARQLAAKAPLLLEAAYLHLAGLLPEELPEGTSAVPHHARLRGLLREELAGLRSLPLEWKRVGVRPNNYPERRLAGAARFVARTQDKGLVATVTNIWKQDDKPLERRRTFEDLFPSATGFWAEHCTWAGKRLTKPQAPIGPGRIRSIIGNVFVPLGLAVARQRRDRAMEARVFDFFDKLPAEPGNAVLDRMLPRIFGDTKPPRMTFRLQQGLLQMYGDWCEPNPSCEGCAVARMYGAKDLPNR